MPQQPRLEVRNVHKSFGEVKALQDVSIKVYPKELVALVGDNGAGKTTLINIIAGVLSPDRGKIFFEGKEIDLNSLNPSRAKRMGIETIHQTEGLVEPISIYRNIFLGKEPSSRFGSLDIKKMKEETRKLLETSVGIGTYRSPDDLAEVLSGGERQAVKVARAFYFKAKILLLDEPLRALSIREKEKVNRGLHKIKEAGVGSVYITHNIYEVYDIADRVVVLDRGKVVMRKTKEETTIDSIMETIRKGQEKE